MKKLLLTAAVIATAFIGTGCSKEEGSKENTQGDPAEVLFVLESPATRALTGGSEAGSAAENKITTLEFYVFNSDGSVDTGVGASAIGANDGNGYVKIGDGVQALGLQHRISLSQGTGKQFLVVANSNLGAIGVKSDGVTDEDIDDIKKRLTTKAFLTTPTLTANPRVVPTSGFEMSGAAVASVNVGNSNQVYVTLTRTVSKIIAPVLAGADVELDQYYLDEIWQGHNLDASTETITFDFKGFAVINGLDKSDICFVGNAAGIYKDPKNVEWDTWAQGTKARITSTFISGTGQYSKNYSGPNANGYFLTDADGPVYINESKPTDLNTPGVNGYAPTSVVSYIIEGTLTPASDTSLKTTRYWRVDLTKDEDFHILRNVVYKVTINKISSPGYGTPEEAEGPDPRPKPGDTTTDFIISIAEWDINEYTTEM